MTAALERYLQGGINSVEGWFGGDQVEFIVRADQFQKEMGVAGGVVEIGVHHGRLLILMMLLRRPGERAVALDVFDKQWMNWDKSGSGDRAIFETNVLTHVGTMDDCVIIEDDSLQVSSSRLLTAGAGTRFRLFSIDGSHTAQSTASDLILADRCLAPGGIIFIDDYSNGGFPMVAEGVARFMLLSPRVTISPILCGNNKVLFTTTSHHEIYIEKFANISTHAPMTIREFYGRKCLCY
jgi:hypothetical protein